MEDERFTRADWIRLIAYNAMIFWQTVVCKGDGPSVAPVFGGIIACGRRAPAFGRKLEMGVDPYGC